MRQKTKGVIAAGHQKTAEAGQEMFLLGGNAFDAAVAAMLMSFVAEPMLTSPAGGGFLLAHTQNQENILFDFFTQTPRQKKSPSELEFYPVELNFGGALQIFHIGKGSVAVPGNLLGVFRVHQKLGRLPFDVVADPAIHYARVGIELNEFQAYSLNLLNPVIFAEPEACKVYAPAGRLLQTGDTLVMKDLGATLASLAENGPDEFYSGEIARQIVKDCQEQGGYLTLEDLKNYQVIERTPLAIAYRGHTLLTNPPPSSGGTLIAFALKLLEKLNLSKVDFASSEHLQILAEVMRLTNEGRSDGYDAYIYEADVADRFLAASHLTSYEQQLTEVVNKWGSTTHISVMDGEGNAASVTTSNGEGSSYVIPGTGIMMNNMLGEEDLNPSGFHKWAVNRRISSMMSPTMVLKDGKPEIVLGSGGSNRIRTAILQVISNLIDFHLPVEQAVESSRCHWENNQFDIEPGLRAEEVKKLNLPPSTQLVLWERKNMFFGGVHTVIKNAELGIMAGAGDRRRCGVVAGV